MFYVKVNKQSHGTQSRLWTYVSQQKFERNLLFLVWRQHRQNQWEIKESHAYQGKLLSFRKSKVNFHGLRNADIWHLENVHKIESMIPLTSLFLNLWGRKARKLSFYTASQVFPIPFRFIAPKRLQYIQKEGNFGWEASF